MRPRFRTDELRFVMLLCHDFRKGEGGAEK